MAETTEYELPESRVERRRRLAQLTTEANDLYAALTAVGQERSELVWLEMNEPDHPATGKDIANATGLSVSRVFKLRDAHMPV